MEKGKKENRLLGAQEILFYAMNEASPKHFLIAAEIEGPTVESDWKSAVVLLQKVHPMLRMSITASGGNLVFTPSTEIPLPFETVPYTAPFDLAQVMEEELEKGFRSDLGPLARVKLFYSEQKCVVIIAAHHSISDALFLFI